ncbi:FG-GAP/YD repeat-containing protein [Caballeronia novacaledonica]|uniref:FG-GAP/YD repeat-containing protein n=1 Tax=Caballeronia novacaledonica TaxID=1544861 RepID=A0A2U3IEB4_9BURK|nr:SpvB/TcaC N-terminal domain-containing protein [Caballeronia novacaledonica]SPB18557.1 FG-GAP/YD repeat-containing protein [Caballeronia novacaledonica]
MGDAASSVIVLPKGGGALHDIGEKFSPDLHTGTGNFTVPIAVPPGRNGLQPQLNLVYSTGHGNGPYGLGWNLEIPGVVRKTSRRVPRYDDSKDVFILSGAEDLVQVSKDGATAFYRPRTEGLFAEIFYHHDVVNAYWKVRSRDGLVSFYGTEASLGHDPAVIAHPSVRKDVFAWKLTRTEDPFGNRIEYDYERDSGQEGPHQWDQNYLNQIRYADYLDGGVRKFLVSVTFEYEERVKLDPFSEYRSGFEIRTRKRCVRIVVRTHAGTDRDVRSYDFIYLDQRPELSAALPINGVSLLSLVKVTGHDDARTEMLPPLEFKYTRFEPEKRGFFPLQGLDLPAQSLANPDLELVDLFGNGLPDFVQMNGTMRYWRNLGNGRFDLPRFMHDAPAGVALADSGVQLIDANGDGRTDLLVTSPSQSGYFPLRFGGQWDRRSFQRFRQGPSFNLEDPEVKLVDLDGDGVTDAIRSGSRLECFFNDPIEGWKNTRWVERQSLEIFPDVNFSDPHVKWADMTGDALQDIVLVHDGSVDYWPNLGYGNWGKRLRMENSPRFPNGYDPKRVLIGDVDGDGLADMVYVGDTEIILWINQSGNRWSDAITISGTPRVSNLDAVRLVDILGTGISGVLWSRDASGSTRDHLFFHDFTHGLKPYLLGEMDNHIGAVTKVEYASSIRSYLDDQERPETRWKTSLPFPVYVVSRVEVIDYFSKGKLNTEYHYHNGHWDGAEYEFRGFGMVEQLDTESFQKYDSDGLHGAAALFAKVDRQYFSPPTCSKTWFHQGPVGDEFGDWQELDWSDQYWKADPQLLRHTETVNQFLKCWPLTPDGRRVKRDALRTLRGSVLRTELYALDGSDREDRPYTVSESSYGLIEIEPPAAFDTQRLHVFYPYQTGHRVTQWERGDDPMTQFSFTRYTDDAGAFDRFGRALAQTQIACPRGWRTMDDKSVDPYLATRTRTLYATPNDAKTYIHSRVAKATTYEIANTSGKAVTELPALKDSSGDLKLIGQTLNYYDGNAFDGLPSGQIGRFGAATRTEGLAFTDDILQQAYGTEIPPYLEPTGNPAWTSEYPAEFRTLLPQRAGYIFHTGSADPADLKGYFIISNRRRFDFQTDPSGVGRGLVLETLDPLHDETVDPTRHRTLIAYDEYELLPKQVTDAAGLTLQATYDYRVLQPSEVTDHNDNKSRFTFSPLGLLENTFVLGKTPTEGDQGRPSVRMEYGFLAYDTSPAANRQPVFVRCIRQIHHDTESDVPQPERDDTITTVKYSDGFGRLLQTRTQGEEVRFGDVHFGGGETVLPANQDDGAGGDVLGQRNVDTAKPNVVVSGWQIYDNKGQVVAKYEPFFSEGWKYGSPEDSRLGQKGMMFYDPRGHVTRTLNPDGSEHLAIYGVPGTIAVSDLNNPDRFEPTPWEAYTYDANDNAGRTHPVESAAYQHHWNTPSSIVVDALGRTVKAVERNRDAPAGGALPPIQESVTCRTYDIRGNVLTIFDALGRRAFHDHIYDYANRQLRIESIDAGMRQTLMDAAGGLVEQRDSKGALILSAYDNLNRPIRLWSRDGEGQKLGLRERLEYGDDGGPGQPAADRANNRATNRLGRLLHHYDEAGLLTCESYDFKGNLQEKTRRVVSDVAILGVFSGPPVGWEVEAFRVDWDIPGSVPLEDNAYASAVNYDALNRAKVLTYPEDVESKRRKLIPHYNRAGVLDSVALDGKAFVERIAYNAKRQRVQIAYGNGIMTRHAYDARTFRLLRLCSETFSKTADLTYRQTNLPLQEFAYQYDLVGNILSIRDRTPGCGINGSAAGLDVLDREFQYDAFYRLRSATGRECDRPPDFPWEGAPRCTDLTKTRSYTELYRYDAVGNIEQIKHLANGAGFTRDLVPVSGNNRLSKLNVGATTFDYRYDANGNTTAETASRHFEWDHADRIRIFCVQMAGSEPSVHAHYLYDAGGQRVKKLVRKQGGQVEVTVYIDGVFEHQRIVRGGNVEQNNTLHVMENQSRIALVRIGNPFAGDTTPAVKYQVSDHLGSSNLVIDDSGKLVNREEFTPYGETSFGNFVRKQYRFAGKERDEVSGLYYYGARYYMPWIGRWMSCDPAGTVDGLNLYNYVRCNPLRLVDRAGTQSSDQPKNSTQYQSQNIHATGNENWAKERKKHTGDANRAWSSAADAAASKRGEPAQGNTSVTGKGVEAHHHADVQASKEAGLHPAIAGEPERMTAAYSRKDPVIKGTIGDKPFEGDTFTPHNTFARMDKYEQDRTVEIAGLKSNTPATIVDASGTSKFRVPATSDYAARAMEKWEADASHQQSPTVLLPTASGRTITMAVSPKLYGTVVAMETLLKVAPKSVGVAFAREGIRNLVPGASELEDFLSHFGNPAEIATAQAALLYLRSVAMESLTAAGVKLATMKAAVTGALTSVAEALSSFGSRLTTPAPFIPTKILDSFRPQGS